MQVKKQNGINVGTSLEGMHDRPLYILALQGDQYLCAGKSVICVYNALTTVIAHS